MRASQDFAYDAPRNRWRHPETGVVIDDEDMPAELVPDEPWVPIEAPADSVTVTVDVDLSAYLAAVRRSEAHTRFWAARIAYAGTAAGVLSVDALGGDGSATNAWRTDARDAYYTALDLTEKPVPHLPGPCPTCGARSGRACTYTVDDSPELAGLTRVGAGSHPARPPYPDEETR